MASKVPTYRFPSAPEIINALKEKPYPGNKDSAEEERVMELFVRFASKRMRLPQFKEEVRTFASKYSLKNCSQIS